MISPCIHCLEFYRCKRIGWNSEKGCQSLENYIPKRSWRADCQHKEISEHGHCLDCGKIGLHNRK